MTLRRHWLVSAAASAALLAGILGPGLSARAQDAGDDSAVAPPPASASATPSAATPTPTAPDAGSPAPGGRSNFRRRGFGGGFGGTVASVTSTGFTYTSRRGNQTVTVTTTPATKITLTHESPMSSIKTGDTVQVFGPADPTAKTVQAYRINDGIAPQFGGGRPGGGGGGGGGRPGFTPTAGQVVSTSPLKIKDAQGVVYTVTPLDATSPINVSTAGTLSDVAVGKYVMVIPSSSGGSVDPTSTAITAQTVMVSPTAPHFGRGGGFGRRAGGGGGGGAGA